MKIFDLYYFNSLTKEIVITHVFFTLDIALV